MSTFPKFADELAVHPGGYHHSYGRVDRSLFAEWFSQRSVQCPRPYLDFLSEIGPGRFFSGGLDLLSVEPGGDLDLWTEKLPSKARAHFFAIGYDGTTEGCYCLRRSVTDDAVYWHNWETGETAQCSPKFFDWIEHSPSKLFNDSAYAGYKKIKSLEQVREIIKQRKAFEVRLLSFDKKLVRPPGKENDFLPRYNRVICGICKRNASDLGQLTFEVRRTGSSVGTDNVQQVTISLPAFAVGQEITVEAFAFDPFNVPFGEIILDYTPEVDLGSPKRARYAELKQYL